MATDSQFALAQRYVPFIDEVYKRESITSVLDTANDQLQWISEDTLKIWKITTNGMGDYSRSNGFVSGTASGSWETLTLSKDRGRKFNIDGVSDREALGMPLATTVSEFLRTQVNPEIDAYTFSKLFAGAGASASAAITVGTTDVPGLIDAADAVMGDAEVPSEGRILFVSEKCYNGLRSKITRYIQNDMDVNRNIEMYNGMRVIRVPQGRFYTKITMYDGSTSGQTDGGYVGTASTGYKLNFMIVHPSALRKVTSLRKLEIIDPAFNNSADGYIVKFRAYYDTFVLDNKKDGIYAHYDTTALS